MEAARRRARGKARYIGASSMFAWQFAKAQHVARPRLDQVRVHAEHYNLIYARKSGSDPQCVDQGVA